MPYLGQDWRGPGHNWTKATSSGWEIRDQNLGVILESVPRNHVKKIIEAFLRQKQIKKNRNLYTNLTSAPVSKCSVREDMNWLQIGLKGSKEIHGYTTLGEMIRRLDLTGATSIQYRLQYIMEIAELLVRNKLHNLSGSAQAHLFQLIQALLTQVLETKRGIRQMRNMLNILMTYLQQQSRKSMFSSKTAWFNSIATVRKWQTDLRLISIPQRVDNQVTLTDLPIELQRKIVSCLNDKDDIISVSHVNRKLHYIAEEGSTWRELCYNDFTEEQVTRAKIILLKKSQRQAKLRLKAGLSVEDKYNYLRPTTAEEWKNIHALMCSRNFEKKEVMYVDPMLFCKRCSVLFWEASGHPCISEVQGMEPDIKNLSPSEVISFFEN